MYVVPVSGVFLVPPFMEETLDRYLIYVPYPGHIMRFCVAAGCNLSGHRIIIIILGDV